MYRRQTPCFREDKKMIEIKPYGFEENGKRFRVECYPFINNKPVSAIAHCRHCTLNNPDETEICYGWKDNPDEAPLFCGPVCPKFELVSGILNVLETDLNCALRQETVLLSCQNL